MKAVQGKSFWVFAVAAALLLGTVAGPRVAMAAGEDYPSKTVTMIAPSKPGSGFDTTARAIANTLAAEKLIPVAMPVMNMAGSVPGTAQIVLRYKNDPYMVAVMSLTGLLNYATGMSPYSYKDTTPIARLISAYYAIFVKYDSPYKTLQDLIRDLKEKPGETALSGGYSDDRIAYGALFSKAGIDITKINYAAFGGGTEAATVVLEGTAKALVSTVDDVIGMVEAKQLRPLSVSGASRISGPLSDVPTFREAGVDVTVENFRYVLGGPNMPDYAVKYWQGVLAKMVKTPTWQENLKRYRWGDSFMVEGFDKFIEQQQTMVNEVVDKLGMKKK
jgi:putative tricarboxylic transport membrane protein